MTPPNISKELLAKFEKGLCTATEYQQVLDWINTADETSEHAQFLQKYWQQPVTHFPEPDYEQLFGKINATIESRATTRKLSWYRQWTRVAAVFLGLLVCSVLGYRYHQQGKQLTYETTYGQHQTIILPDQSVVKLNGNSKITYAADWEAQEPREVWLEGEGFFEVQHLQNHQKFIVHTKKNLAIEVLGTKFNVRARPSGTQVVLNSGTIRLDIPQAKSLVMKPGELVQFKEKPAAYTKTSVNPTIFSAWKEHKLVLNNTSLQEILTRLRETHGLKVQVSDPALLNLKGSGTMPAENVETLLQVLSETFELRIKRTPSVLILEPANQAPQ